MPTSRKPRRKNHSKPRASQLRQQKYSFTSQQTAYIIAGLFLALICLGMLKQFLGFAAFVNIDAGTITELIVYKKEATTRWSGVFGLALRLEGFNDTQSLTMDVSEVGTFNPVFDCIPPDSIFEIYAARVPLNTLDFATAQPAPLSWVNSFINATNGSTDSAQNTYSAGYMNITVGTTTILNISSTYTFVQGDSDATTFQTGPLNISGELVYVTKVTSVDRNFKGGTSNFQILLGQAEDAVTWYFGVDPFDVCPKGTGSGIAGSIEGYTLDEQGNILPNVSVYLGSSSNTTNETGFYNLTEIIGTYQIIGVKPGYETYIAQINLTTSFQEHNITMVLASNATQEVVNGTLFGYARDNVTGFFVPNVTVSIYGVVKLTNGSGFYNTTVGEGTHNLIALHTNYEVYVANETVFQNQITEHNITLIPRNGTLSGTVRESTYSLPLNGVTVLLSGSSGSTNSSGDYSLQRRHGNHTVAFIHPDYESLVASVRINPGETSYLNVTLDPKQGTVQGYITSNATGEFLSNVTVTLMGEQVDTSSGGFYNITVDSGATTLAAQKTGYLPFFANISVPRGSVLNYNISLENLSQGVNGSLQQFGRIVGSVSSSAGGLIENATVNVAGYENQSSSLGLYAVTSPSGTHNLVATATGFEVYVASINVTAGNDTTHDIIMDVQVPSAVGPGVSDGVGPGQSDGVGPGEDEQRPIVPLIEQPLELIEFDVSQDRILKKLRQGTFADVRLFISNYRKQIIRVTFDVEGEVAPLVKLEREELLIDAEGTASFKVLLLGDFPPGVYSGTLHLRGDIEKDIPIDLLIYSQDKLPIELLLMKLSLGKSKVAQGSVLSYKVDLQNLLRDEEYRVFLFYQLENLDTNETFFIDDRDVVLLDTTTSVIKRFRVGTDISPGEYQLAVDAQYLNFTATKKAYVKITLPLAQYQVFGLIPLWILALILGTLLLFGILGFIYYRQQRKKKRYLLSVDYTTMPKPGPRSAYVGLFAETTKKAYFDIDLFQIHTLVAGSTGSGKSISAQVMIEEALMHGAAVIVFDPTAQWTGYLRKCIDPHFLQLYERFGMKKSEARAFNGNIRQILDAREKIDIVKYIKPGEITIFAINRLQPEDIDILVSNTIQSVFKADLPESKTLRLIVLFEEVHRLLPKFGGSGDGFRQIERGAREFRKWGVALLMISQVLGDFAGEIKANINTEIQMRTRHEGDMKKINEQFGPETLRGVVKAQVGTGMVQNSSYNHGRPFFVSFRPLLHNTARLPEEEIQQYNKFNDIIDDIEFQMEQLKEEKVDTFDLELELKLAKDKLKSGNFNMVSIYLEGLTPRLGDMWKKIGKTPKKAQRQLVTKDDLQEGMQAAIAARQKAEAENAQKPAAPPGGTPPNPEQQAQGGTAGKEDAGKKNGGKGSTEGSSNDSQVSAQSGDAGKENAGGSTSNEQAVAPVQTATQSAQPAQMTAPVQTNQTAPSPAVPLNELQAEVQQATAQKDKKILLSLYKRIQERYAHAEKQEKQEIFKLAQLIRGALS